ncbi:hypothetical protein BDW69DRAFT_90836 [Aspergillus filifer]
MNLDYRDAMLVLICGILHFVQLMACAERVGQTQIRDLRRQEAARRLIENLSRWWPSHKVVKNDGLEEHKRDYRKSKGGCTQVALGKLQLSSLRVTLR